MRMNTKLFFSLLFIVGCTSTPNGAISYNSIRYYVDDKFHEKIPEDYIFKTWGYRDDPFGRDLHTYRNKVMIPHGRKKQNGVQSIDSMKSLRHIGIQMEMATFIG